MNHYETRGAALDRFLAEHEIDREDVLSVRMSELVSDEHDIHVHIYNRVPGLEYVPDEQHPTHTTATVEREDLTIHVLHVQHEGKEVTA